jgi:predicted PurR-regulated permease PerM
MREFREISWQSVWRLVLIAIFIALFFYLRSVLVILFFSIIISSAFDPIIDWFQKKGFGRILGTIIVYLLTLGILSSILFFLVPILYQEVLGVIDLVPGYSEKIANYVIGSTFASNINEIVLNYGNSFMKGGTIAISVLFSVIGGLVSVLSVLLISFYLLIKRDGIESFLRAVLPQSMENTVIRIWERVRLRVGHWFRIQILLSLFVGLLVFISLLILGVKYSFILGIIAAIFEIVPIAGPIFAGAASILVALTQSPSLAIWVAIIFILIQQLESNILTPLIMKRSVGINPVIVIISLLAGAQLGGIVGIVLAMPVVVFLEEIVLEMNRRKVRYLPVE